jgi:hypothetical protein
MRKYTLLRPHYAQSKHPLSNNKQQQINLQPPKNTHTNPNQQPQPKTISTHHTLPTPAQKIKYKLKTTKQKNSITNHQTLNSTDHTNLTQTKLAKS